MRINFSLLWFDDSEIYFDSLDIESLKGEILSWGFNPIIELAKTPEEFTKHSPFVEYDLIVVDQLLEGYDEGQEFIAKLRSSAIYTEVIFYTAGNASALWDAIRDKELEGVFISTRNDVLSKIYKVGRQSIRKVLDLDNMRGIVMTEVGELDHLLDEILKIGIGSLPLDQQKRIFESFCQGAAEQNRNLDARLVEFSKSPQIPEMLNLCDSNKRWQNFNRLWKEHDKLRGKDKVGDFDKDVLKPRNFLAHGKPEAQDDGSYIFRHQGKTFLFDDTASSTLRHTILKYKTAFSGILTMLS